MKAVGGNLSAASQDAQRDRQIKCGGLFWQFRWGEIDDDSIVRPIESRVDHRPGHAVRALADGRVGQADDNGRRKCSCRDIDFNFNRHSINPKKGECLKAGKHSKAPL